MRLVIQEVSAALAATSAPDVSAAFDVSRTTAMPRGVLGGCRVGVPALTSVPLATSLGGAP